MSDASTKRMIDRYVEEAEAPMFLSGFFKSPPRNFHRTEKVEIDILRDDEDVALVIQDISSGARLNEGTQYTNKGFTPPIYNEAGSIVAWDQMSRQPGANPFDDPVFGANAVQQSFRVFRKSVNKIRRAVELQASQVLQTGQLSLTDQNGDPLFELDYSPKASHFVTVGNDWTGGSATPMADIEGIAQTIRRNGKKVPNVLLFGNGAFNSFQADADVRALMDNRQINVGQIVPNRRGAEGATFKGTISIGNYNYEMWTYDGYYRDPQSGLHVPYITDDKVVVLATGGRLDLTFGSIPLIAPPDERAMAFIPSRVESSELGLALSLNAWITPDNTQVQFSAGTRPLCIPTAIDTFGCLDTVA